MILFAQCLENFFRGFTISSVRGFLRWERPQVFSFTIITDSCHKASTIRLHTAKVARGWSGLQHVCAASYFIGENLGRRMFTPFVLTPGQSNFLSVFGGLLPPKHPLAQLFDVCGRFFLPFSGGTHLRASLRRNGMAFPWRGVISAFRGVIAEWRTGVKQRNIKYLTLASRFSRKNNFECFYLEGLLSVLTNCISKDGGGFLCKRTAYVRLPAFHYAALGYTYIGFTGNATCDFIDVYFPAAARRIFLW
mgnify:CR=1 FL=1